MKNLGNASILIKLTDNKIKVYHGTDKNTLLFEKTASQNDWCKIWSAIEN